MAWGKLLPNIWLSFLNGKTTPDPYRMVVKKQASAKCKVVNAGSNLPTQQSMKCQTASTLFAHSVSQCLARSLAYGRCSRNIC